MQWTYNSTQLIKCMPYIYTTKKIHRYVTVINQYTQIITVIKINYACMKDV